MDDGHDSMMFTMSIEGVEYLITRVSTGTFVARMGSSDTELIRDDEDFFVLIGERPEDRPTSRIYYSGYISYKKKPITYSVTSSKTTRERWEHLRHVLLNCHQEIDDMYRFKML